MEKLFPILTISTCGTSLGMSWWWDSAKRKTSYSCDSVGNNPPVEQQRITSYCRTHSTRRWNEDHTTQHNTTTHIIQNGDKVESEVLVLRQKKGLTRHSHLYWYYLENLSLNPSTSPVNWCRGWWSFAAYFRLHWRREKEPKSKHRFVRVRS